MQIDFHFDVTYTVARMAGLSHDESQIIAYSSQYVDDATNQGNVKFENGAMYNRLSSAHKMLDYRNFEELANHHVWIPFHFLPGNGGLPAGENPEGSFIDKIVCRPNSYVAQDMIETCISHKEKPYALHLLGITSHVYADTWAHQGFAGVTHDINSIYDIEDEDENDSGIIARLSDFFEDMFDKVASKITSDVKPLGHGAALSHPDMPFLKWSYKNGRDEPVNRDNTEIFIEAASHLYALYRNFQGFNENPSSFSEENKTLIRQRFLSFTQKESNKRHDQWLNDLKSGQLGFEAPSVNYSAKGKNSWKYKALGTENEVDLLTDVFPYKPEFLVSDWKLFHDALQLHRYYVIHDILPRYGICAA